MSTAHRTRALIWRAVDRRSAPQGLGDTGMLTSVLFVSLLAVGVSLAAMILIAARLQQAPVSRLASTVFGRATAVLLGAASLSLLLTRDTTPARRGRIG